MQKNSGQRKKHRWRKVFSLVSTSSPVPATKLQTSCIQLQTIHRCFEHVKYRASPVHKCYFQIRRAKPVPVNVFGCDEGDEIYPLLKTKCRVTTDHFNLILLTSAQGGKYYCFITNISRMLSTLTKTQMRFVFTTTICIASHTNVFWPNTFAIVNRAMNRKLQSRQDGSRSCILQIILTYVKYRLMYIWVPRSSRPVLFVT